MNQYRSLGIGSLLVVAAMWLVPAAPVAADYPYGARGEVARLGRQLYDFHYSGRRTAHDSIRFKGRPTHHTFQRQRRPHYGPYGRVPSRGGHGYGHGYGHARPYVTGCATPALRPVYIVEQAPAPRPQPLTRDDIEMVPVRVAPRTPTQRAVIERVVLADGTSRTVIRSVPIEDTGRSPGRAEGQAVAEAEPAPEKTAARAVANDG